MDDDPEYSIAQAVIFNVAMRLIRLATPRPKAPHLPAELIYQILEHLDLDVTTLYHAHIAEIGPTIKAHYSVLRNIALVSRMWSKTASDLLLRHVLLETDKNAGLWRFNPRGVVHPKSLVLAGTVSRDEAIECFLHCRPSTRHLGLHMRDPFSVEYLFRDQIAGLKSLTIGGPFRIDFTLGTHNKLAFSLDHLAVHGYGIPLILLGSMLPDTAILNGAEIYPLIEEGVAVNQPVALTTWTLRHTLTVAHSDTSNDGRTAVLPQPEPPTAGVLPLHFKSIGKRIVTYEHQDSPYICVELPVSYRFAGLIERCWPSLKMLSTTGYATPDFDDERSDTFGSMFFNDFENSKAFSQFRPPKLVRPVVAEPGLIWRLANGAAQTAKGAVVGAPTLASNVLYNLRDRLW